MASALLSLHDLINFQLERLKLDEFVFKDELHLQRTLADLDLQQRQQQQQQQHRQLHQSQSQQWPAPHKPPTTTAAGTSAAIKRQKARKCLQQQQQQPNHTQPQQQHGTPSQQQQALHASTAELGETNTASNASTTATMAAATASTAAATTAATTDNTVSSKENSKPNSQLPQTVADSRKLAGKFSAIAPAATATAKSGGGIGGGVGVGVSGLSRRATTAGFETANDELFGAFGFDPGTGTTATSIADSEGSSIVSDPHRRFRAHVLEWFQQLHEQTLDFKSDEESRRVREAGNDSYRKERHPLKAADLYTEAIFLAPAEDSIAAAMAHANRSTVLHDFGMYEQSYDDCLCALDLGYPEEYLALIKLRQASCALKMRNFVLCEEHLHELLHMELTELFQERTHEIWHECEVLKSQKFEMGVQTDSDLLGNTKMYEIAWHDNSNIITTNKGSYMRATHNVATNAPLLQDEAAVFVPSGQARICDNCATTQFIPFPCSFCANRNAVYCSRKCRSEHASIHALECFAHQIELFEEFAEEFAKPRLLQLALRMLIKGLPQMVPHCRKKPTVGKMWAACNGVLTERNDIPYSALLRLEAHAHKEDLENLVANAVIAHILAIYLSECTDFFEQLEFSMPPSVRLARDEWELLSAALTLRHICQLRHKNIIHCPSFVLPANPHVLAPFNEFSLWAGLKHLREGQLHLLAGQVAHVAYAVYPHTLSICRHSCADLLYCKFNGRRLHAYATSDIDAGASVTNCFYSGNHRQSLYETRQQDLLAKGIDCKCEKCFRPYPDEDFTKKKNRFSTNFQHKFHRYRCDNPKCKQIFTPLHLKYTRNLRWWNSDYYTCPENNGSELLVCSVCEQTQKLEWFWTYHAALLDCDSIEERCKLYAAIDRADLQLVEMHELKVALARQLVERCLLMHRERTSTPLDEWEFNKLGSIMRSALPIVAAQYRVFSMEYVQHMSYFWDVMALSNYKCNDKELMQMLHALEFIPDEFKEIFINYYEDHIAPKFAEPTYTNFSDTQV